MVPTRTAHPDFARVVELARLAPSVHNTQPWLFQAADEVLTLRLDSDRRLPALDPVARQQTISCGAALYLARLGLRLQGFDSTVEMATSAADGVLARLHVGRGAPVTAEEIVLEHAAQSRHTQRGIFENRPVAQEIVATMRDAAQEQGAWVRILSDPGDQVALAVLLARAEEAEIGDPSYRSELADWTERPPAAHDGVPERAIPPVRHRASTLRLRDFSVGDETDVAEPVNLEGQPPPPEHVLAIVLGTAGDEISDWLVAGQGLIALLLRAVIDGVQASPLGQVVDQPWSRRQLASEIGCVGHPQMVLRVGHASPGPETPRRPVGDILS